ncbi:MAG: NAD(P)H-hydrate dehydratase [candidate division Zixibacteria bacterium]|nr:NAD(P)H-hydrate dehydratase [candidate division Zixibacteria bacterium]
MKLVTAAQMRRIDRLTSEQTELSSARLMENAGSGIAELIISALLPASEGSVIHIYCGRGNNGGDGFVLARHLAEEGASVTVFYIGPTEKISQETRLNLDHAIADGIHTVEISSVDDLPHPDECDLVVDAILGSGSEGAPEGLAAEMIEHINLHDCIVVSVDIPSGVNPDSGEAVGAVVEADYTYALGLPKYGLFLTPGRELAGEIEVIPIGIPDEIVESVAKDCLLLTDDAVADLLPERKFDGHKGEFGKLCVIAGSTGLTGAAALAGLSALRSGCGTVVVGTPASVQPILAIKLTEVMTHPLPDVGKKGALALRALGEIRALIKKHDAVVIGPGLGRHHETFELVRRLVAKMDKPCLIDADGLNALAGQLAMLRDCSIPPILTPHGGEFERLTGLKTPDDIHQRIALVRKVATENKIVLVLKGSPTLVATPAGEVYLNPTGNNGMATGGTGDVLSGIIGSFLAQGMTPDAAAVCGVYVHGLAGDFVAETFTQRAMIAGDIMESLPYAFEYLE